MTPESRAAQITPNLDEFRERGSPLIATESVPACPVCGCVQYAEYATGYDYELLTCVNLWRFVQCSDCGHVWLNPRPALVELGVIYPPTYYAYNYSGINPIARNAKTLLDRSKMAKILRSRRRKPHTYLDVGCGNGRFLKVIEKLGVPRSSLYGLELDQRVVNHLREEGYGKVFCERVEDASEIPVGGIDLVTMFHVIEHVDNPSAVVRRVVEWLASGGVFALETPNLGGISYPPSLESLH